MGGSIGTSSASSGFGSASTSTSANDSTNSPGPNTVTTTASGSGSQQNVQQQQQQQQTAFANLVATSALAAQQMPPGYAYFYGNMGTALPAAAYGAATATPSHVYQPTMTVPGAGATATSQFQKTYGTSNYGSGYDTLGQQGSKDFNSYSSNGQSKSSGGSAGAGSGHQYWGNTLTSAQL